MRNNVRNGCQWQLLTLAGCLALGTVGWSPSFAQQASDVPSEAGDGVGSDAELSAIRAGSRDFVSAFNAGDADAIAALWTPDGEYIDDVGHRFVGRDAIERGYSDYFADSPQSKLRIMIDSLRLLSENTAIEDGRAVVDPPPVGVPGYSKYTVIHVKVDGKWLMASVRDTHVETPSGFRNVADLEWLIGSWIAEEQGNRIESVCSWIANKSFVERKYTVTQFDGSVTAGVQIIGWNALNEHVQSWDFSPDGGHAVGVWSPHEGGWTAEIQGVTGDGAVTTSVNGLTKMDEGAYVWQSVARTVDGVALPDSDEVVIKRQSDGP